MNKTLTALVLGAGVLGAGCTTDRMDCGVRAHARQDMEYIHDVNETQNESSKDACSNKFPAWETKAFQVEGVKDGRVKVMDYCCIVERHEYTGGLMGLSAGEELIAGYCTKM